MTHTSAPQTRPLGAQISHMLKARGVDVIFGIPGVHNVEMYRGIEEAGITHVLARHEQGAGFMADGYSRASGKPGVAYVITGPGLCNIMTPMGQGYSDNVSMLVISSCLDEVNARKGQLHQMHDQEAAAATVCDWSHIAKTPASAYRLVDRAFEEFASNRPRPKHIQIPIAVLGTEADPAPAKPNAPSRPTAPDAIISQIAQAIEKAKRPMFIFGDGLVGAAQTARALTANSGAAVFTTNPGRGVADSSAPNYCGTNLARPGSVNLIAKADLVVTFGTSLIEVDLWRADLGHSCPLICVDLDPSELDQPHVDLRVTADPAQIVQALAKTVTPRKKSGWDNAEITAARAQWRAQTDSGRPGILPILETLQAALPNDTMVYSDMTQMAYVAKEVWEMDRPGHWHHPYGFGTLGYGMPAAIGGAIARKGKPTVAIVGDYGFHYTMQELGVAVELELPLVIILWDNGKLKEIEDSMVRSQIAPNAVIARNPNFCKLAEAFGALSAEPSDLAQLTTAVQRALHAKGPTLIRITPQITS